MLDMDISRNRQLIEEQEEYENSFISIEDIIKSDEMDFQIAEYEFLQEMFENEDYFMNDFDMNFDSEDYMNQLRDEQLIEQREAYELSIYLDVEDYYEDYDPLDAQIDLLNEYCPYSNHFVYRTYEDYINEYDFIHSYDYDECYVEEINVDGAYCGNRLYGYVVEDDDFDSFDEYDYPDGPSENLNGFAYPEPDYQFIDFPDEYYDDPEPEYYIKDFESDLVCSDDLYMTKLIEEHIKEENEFLEYVKKYEVPDEYFIPAGMNDIILC